MSSEMRELVRKAEALAVCVMAVDSYSRDELRVFAENFRDEARALLTRTEAGAVKCSDCDGDGETCLAGRSAHRSNWIKCAKCNGTGDAAPVADGLYAWVRESPRHWERVTESDLSQPADPQKMRAGGWFPVYTHPQDASGDADAAYAILDRLTTTREGCLQLAKVIYRELDKVEKLLDEAVEKCAAMQAKEAK